MYRLERYMAHSSHVNLVVCEAKYHCGIVSPTPQVHSPVRGHLDTLQDNDILSKCLFLGVGERTLLRGVSAPDFELLDTADERSCVGSAKASNAKYGHTHQQYECSDYSQKIRPGFPDG